MTSTFDLISYFTVTTRHLSCEISTRHAANTVRACSHLSDRGSGAILDARSNSLKPEIDGSVQLRSSIGESLIYVTILLLLNYRMTVILIYFITFSLPYTVCVISSLHLVHIITYHTEDMNSNYQTTISIACTVFRSVYFMEFYNYVTLRVFCFLFCFGTIMSLLLIRVSRMCVSHF